MAGGEARASPFRAFRHAESGEKHSVEMSLPILQGGAADCGTSDAIFAFFLFFRSFSPGKRP
jgi:hypothetical protein